MNRLARYAPETHERAVRMVPEHQSEYSSQWAAICAVAAKIGCQPETLQIWVRQAERNQSLRSGPPSSEITTKPKALLSNCPLDGGGYESLSSLLIMCT